MPGNAPDRACEWSDLHFRPPITSQRQELWRSGVAVLVLVVHIALLTGLLLHKVRIPETQVLRFEVSFVDRVAAPALPAKEVGAPQTARPSQIAQVPDAKARPALQVVEVLPHEAEPLRLHLVQDPWQPPTTRLEHDPLARRPSDHLPGRAEPLVPGIRVESITPEMAIKHMGKLFGAIDPDPCPGARERLANLESNRDHFATDADLRKVERYCRP